MCGVQKFLPLKKKRITASYRNPLHKYGAERESRTPTSVRILDPEPSASTNSTISATKEKYLNVSWLSTKSLSLFLGFIFTFQHFPCYHDSCLGCLCCLNSQLA